MISEVSICGYSSHSRVYYRNAYDYRSACAL
jgi:hypothetical protein